MDFLSSSTVGRFNKRLTSRRAPSWSLTQHITQTTLGPSRAHSSNNMASCWDGKSH